MDWFDVETAIKNHITAQWALVGAPYSTWPIVWENEDEITGAASFVQVDIQGNFTESTRYGSVGKRSAVDYGLVFFHAFVPRGSGKSKAVHAVVLFSRFMELRSLSGVIDFLGANPPTPVEQGQDQDYGIPGPQPGGEYYRCSGSVEFTVRNAR